MTLVASIRTAGLWRLPSHVGPSSALGGLIRLGLPSLCKRGSIPAHLRQHRQQASHQSSDYNPTADPRSTRVAAWGRVVVRDHRWPSNSHQGPARGHGGRPAPHLRGMELRSRYQGLCGPLSEVTLSKCRFRTRIARRVNRDLPWWYRRLDSRIYTDCARLHPPHRDVAQRHYDPSLMFSRGVQGCVTPPHTRSAAAPTPAFSA